MRSLLEKDGVKQFSVARQVVLGFRISQPQLIGRINLPPVKYSKDLKQVHSFILMALQLFMKVRRVWFMNLNLAGYWHLGSQVTLLA